MVKRIQCYLVGDFVRDRLRGLPVQDRDWMVIGQTPESMLVLTGGAWIDLRAAVQLADLLSKVTRCLIENAAMRRDRHRNVQSGRLT